MAYKYKFTKLVWILLGLLTTLFLTSLVSLIYKLISYIGLDDWKKIFYSSLILLVLFLLLIVVALVFIRRYKIKKDKICLRLGLFLTIIDVNKIVEFKIYNGKLTLFLDDARYTVIVIDKKYFDNFVSEVRKINPLIIYSKND
ncbi:MAG: hypothetical protein E7342_02100 [Clostridiales bacterium]|nr:hypothetical protein [Clostridiales bacterium]